MWRTDLELRLDADSRSSCRSWDPVVEALFRPLYDVDVPATLRLFHREVRSTRGSRSFERVPPGPPSPG